MNEKDLLNKMRSDADHITPPDSLSPQSIEQLLSENKKKKGISRRAVRFGSLAAVCVLTLSVGWTAAKVNQYSGKSEFLGESETPAAEDNSANSTTLAAEDNSNSTTLATEDNSADSTTLAAEDNSADSAAPVADAFTYASDYNEVYEALQAFTASYEEMGFYTVEDSVLYSSGTGAPLARSGEEFAVSESADFSADADSAVINDSAELSSASDSSIDFSDTNKQEAGVDEADIIKTDGTYLYILRKDCSLAIIKADSAASAVTSITQISDANDSYIQEMYLDGDRLTIVLHESATVLKTENASDTASTDSASPANISETDSASPADISETASASPSDTEATAVAIDTASADIFYTETMRQTAVYTYDISDRSAPKLLGKTTQDGYYADSRKVGSYLYLFTRYYPDVNVSYDTSTIVPRINGVAADASAFYLPEQLQDTAYLIISSIDIRKPETVLDSKILVSGASEFYVSGENIYITNEQYDYSGNGTRTEITKFHYENGKITGVAAASVKGYLNDAFSMNEYNGYLRLVTTYYDGETERNGLFIFDENLNQTGAIQDLAAGEIIQSARFFGDTGYFVTFRQTDPLFSVDLSDPKAPKLLGELKISGFSSYLHFYGEDLLLGIGYEAEEDTGITTGLKLSMFDISDPSDVKEISKLVLSGITWCPALDDYKSIFVQPEKNLIGFYCDNRYLVFSFDPEQGFVQELVYDFYSDLLMNSAEYDTVRGLYIEDTLYIAGETFLLSFDMTQDFAKTGILRI